MMPTGHLASGGALVSRLFVASLFGSTHYYTSKYMGDVECDDVFAIFDAICV